MSDKQEQLIEKPVEPCDDCFNDTECDGGPFCGCPCHDGSLADRAEFLRTKRERQGQA